MNFKRPIISPAGRSLPIMTAYQGNFRALIFSFRRINTLLYAFYRELVAGLIEL